MRAQNMKQMSNYGPVPGTSHNVAWQGPESPHMAQSHHVVQPPGTWVGPHELDDHAVNEVPGTLVFSPK